MVFKPGDRANPHGRPPATPPNIKELALKYTPEALLALRKALKSPGERVPAANLLLSYAYGKPASNLNMRVITSVQDLSEDELLALAGGVTQHTIEAQADSTKSSESQENDDA